MITKTEAVNRLLAAIGEEPVTSLTSGLPEAQSAENFLDRVSHDIQALGWHANTDQEIEIIRNVSDEYAVASTWLAVDTINEHEIVDVSVRRDLNDGQLKLFDNRKGKKSFKFPEYDKLWVRIVYEFDFEDIPPLLQAFIAAEAAMLYQQSELGSSTLDQFVIRERDRAWQAFIDSEEEADDYNILSGNQFCRGVVNRNNPYYAV